MKKRLFSFGAVGVFNTGLNILTFNVLLLLGLGAGLANFISICLSIIIAYILSSRLVFSDRANKESSRIKFVKFILVNVITLFIVHQLLLLYFVYYFTAPGELAYEVIGRFSSFTTRAFIEANTAKSIAVLGSMVASFMLYDKFVFKDNN